ncbi:hypothetical protein [Bradyrhizobium sp. 18]|uniref:hypothetical protein n=2 Tax=unclassified Bradyrhizobium TaxID=2631580 RepID=UPI001FFBB4DF|nr:hypothetical protein [Bradyrhizobium sp. 18]MCK1506863.1 hypothetical protein [Bradyrhizobium sp. 18]
MPDWTAESEAAFGAYVDALIGVIGHAERAEPLTGPEQGAPGDRQGVDGASPLQEGVAIDPESWAIRREETFCGVKQGLLGSSSPSASF